MGGGGGGRLYYKRTFIPVHGIVFIIIDPLIIPLKCVIRILLSLLLLPLERIIPLSSLHFLLMTRTTFLFLLTRSDYFTVPCVPIKLKIPSHTVNRYLKTNNEQIVKFSANVTPHITILITPSNTLEMKHQAFKNKWCCELISSSLKIAIYKIKMSF